MKGLGIYSSGLGSRCFDEVVPLARCFPYSHCLERLVNSLLWVMQDLISSSVGIFGQPSKAF